MEINAELIERVIKRVVREVTSQAEYADAVGSDAVSREVVDGIFDDMDAAVRAAAAAQVAYMDCSLAVRRRIVAAIREVALKPEHLEYMSSAAAEETGMGDATDKLLKNRYVTERTPGVEDLVTDAWSGDDGLTTVEYSPFGVIGAITPSTNPTETMICNAIGMLAAGNSVVFSPHPRAKEVSMWLIRRINEALALAGAPRNLVVTVREPSIESTNALMAHPLVRMLVATGGPGIVKTVMASGKKAIGAGAGNPPVVVDTSADIERAARDIVAGASFDNNLPCTSEKEVIAVDAITDILRFHMKKHGAYEIRNRDLLTKLEELILDDRRRPRPEWIGKAAGKILAELGVEAPPGTRLIIVETSADHPFCQHELMMPVLPIVRAPDIDAAIELAVQVEHGNRHTAVMHSKDVTKLTKMARAIQTTIFVKNGPSYSGIGIGGEGYCSFTIAGPTGEGLTSARSFARRRRCVLVGDLNVR